MPKIPGIPHFRAVRALERTGFVIARQGKAEPVFLKGGELMAEVLAGRISSALAFVELVLKGRDVKTARWGIMRPMTEAEHTRCAP